MSSQPQGRLPEEEEEEEEVGLVEMKRPCLCQEEPHLPAVEEGASLLHSSQQLHQVGEDSNLDKPPLDPHSSSNREEDREMVSE